MSIESDIVGVAEKEYGENYRVHVLEMYKLYVEMADKISERRQSANSFFLTLNSAIITFVGYANLSSNQLISPILFFSTVSIAGMVICFLWYRLIHSYKDMNSGKFNVIHAIEKQLPLRLYDAEWVALGSGKDPKLYLPFTHIEIIVPWIFFGIHLFVLIGSILAIK